MGQVTMEKQLLRRCRNRTTTILLNHDTGWVIGRALLRGRAGAAIRKEVKAAERQSSETDCKEGARAVWPPILRGWRRPT